MSKTPDSRCPSVHALGGMRCIREAGHDGKCWSKAGASCGGAITRGEWKSKDGKFVKHYQYATFYARNGNRKDHA